MCFTGLVKVTVYSLAANAGIMVALKKRDAEAAQAAMRAHIESGQVAAGQHLTTRLEI